MSRLYEPVRRSLQDRFDTRRLADNVEARVVLTEIPREHKAFIESRDMFFLSTIDHQGRPTVSYKGGDPGFVRVLNGKTVAFPCTTATACSIRWVTCSGTPKSASVRQFRNPTPVPERDGHGRHGSAQQPRPSLTLFQGR